MPCVTAASRAVLQRMLSWSLMTAFTKDNSYVEFNERPADEQLVGGHTACHARHTMATLTNDTSSAAPGHLEVLCLVCLWERERAAPSATRRNALLCAALRRAALHCT